MQRDPLPFLQVAPGQTNRCILVLTRAHLLCLLPFLKSAAGPEPAAFTPVGGALHCRDTRAPFIPMAYHLSSMGSGRRDGSQNGCLPIRRGSGLWPEIACLSVSSWPSLIEAMSSLPPKACKQSCRLWCAAPACACICLTSTRVGSQQSPHPCETSQQHNIRRLAYVYWSAAMLPAAEHAWKAVQIHVTHPQACLTALTCSSGALANKVQPGMHRCSEAVLLC